MRRGLFRTMALVNIRNNHKFYLPFLLTILLIVAMFYNICEVSVNPAFTTENAVQSVLYFGVWLIGIFAVIFLFYTNSFLMRRRKSELGLYHILGLDKRHIARILAWETLLLAFWGIAGGLIVGLLLDRLMFWLLLRMFHYAIEVSYRLSLYPVCVTLLLFGGIFLLLYLFNVWSVRRSSALELLGSAQRAEWEPKTRWLIALLGITCLAAGYSIALTVDNVADALSLLFVAVLLVAAGTYCLFLAGSVVILKALRRWQTYYYRTSHFVAVSGLIYRMKQNAVGLANICILSTGVLLVVSTTVCMYTGLDSITEARFPAEIQMSFNDASARQMQELEDLVAETAQENGLRLENYRAYDSLNFSLALQKEELRAQQSDTAALSFKDVAAVTLIAQETYEKLTGTTLELGEEELAAYHTQGKLNNTFSLLGENYVIKEELQDFPVPNRLANIVPNWFNFVVSSEKKLAAICQKQQELLELPSMLNFDLDFNVSGSAEEARQLAAALEEHLAQRADLPSGLVQCRYQFREDSFAMYGSMLFLGLYLGALFLLATVLIIYYKQIIEGYEDRERYLILRKVGMDEREVKQSIRSQILILFFLPLVTALVHCLAAFPLMTRILQAFYMHNNPLFAAVTAVVAGIFTGGYILVFALTSRSYYHIIS